jgi:hypothetical protein
MRPKIAIIIVLCIVVYCEIAGNIYTLFEDLYFVSNVKYSFSVASS